MSNVAIYSFKLIEKTHAVLVIYFNLLKCKLLLLLSTPVWTSNVGKQFSWRRQLANHSNNDKKQTTLHVNSRCVAKGPFSQYSLSFSCTIVTWIHPSHFTARSSISSLCTICLIEEQHHYCKLLVI